MLRNTFFLILLFLSVIHLDAQVGIGTLTPNASAQLDISSANKGLLIPRLRQGARDSISNPPAGLLIYQTNGLTPGFTYFDGNQWTPISGSTMFTELDTTNNLGNPVKYYFLDSAKYYANDFGDDHGYGALTLVNSMYDNDSIALKIYGKLGDYHHGGKISFGDENYVYIQEINDDDLKIYSNNLFIENNDDLDIQAYYIRMSSEDISIDAQNELYINTLDDINLTAQDEVYIDAYDDVNFWAEDDIYGTASDDISLYADSTFIARSGDSEIILNNLHDSVFIFGDDVVHLKVDANDSSFIQMSDRGGLIDIYADDILRLRAEGDAEISLSDSGDSLYLWAEDVVHIKVDANDSSFIRLTDSIISIDLYADEVLRIRAEEDALISLHDLGDSLYIWGEDVASINGGSKSRLA